METKEWVVFIVSDKTQASKWKLEFWRTHTLYCEFDSLILGDFSEVSNDISKWDFFKYFMWNVSTFGGSEKVSEPIFSMHDITKLYIN